MTRPDELEDNDDEEDDEGRPDVTNLIYKARSQITHTMVDVGGENVWSEYTCNFFKRNNVVKLAYQVMKIYHYDTDEGKSSSQP